MLPPPPPPPPPPTLTMTDFVEPLPEELLAYAVNVVLVVMPGFCEPVVVAGKKLVTLVLLDHV